MAVSCNYAGDSNRGRKISLSSIKNALVRKTSRQSGPRPRVCCSESAEDANGDSETHDKDVICSSLYASLESTSDNCQRKRRPSAGSSFFNEKRNQSIFKSLKKKFNFKTNISTTGLLPLPLWCKSKQTVKAQSASSSAFSVIEDSSQGEDSLCPPLPPRVTLSARPTTMNRSRLQTLNLPHEDDPLVVSRPDLQAFHKDDANEFYEEVPPSPIRSLTVELLKLANYGWYWGPISRSEAEEKLRGLPDGAFLVRDSLADKYLLSVSFRSADQTLHTRIEHSHGLFSFYRNTKQDGFESIVELIDHSMSCKANIGFSQFPSNDGNRTISVRLLNPISRYTHVRSLQHLCRFVIRQTTRIDNIQKLPLPTTLKGYIQEGHY